jgi:hypothetical protein
MDTSEKATNQQKQLQQNINNTISTNQFDSIRNQSCTVFNPNTVCGDNVSTRNATCGANQYFFRFVEPVCPTPKNPSDNINPQALNKLFDPLVSCISSRDVAKYEYMKNRNNQ